MFAAVNLRAVAPASHDSLPFGRVKPSDLESQCIVTDKIEVKSTPHPHALTQLMYALFWNQVNGLIEYTHLLSIAWCVVFLALYSSALRQCILKCHARNVGVVVQ